MSESQKNPSCFSSIFKRLICAANLPTYPDHHHNHNQINNTVSSDVLITQKNTQLALEEQNAAQIKPGIVARLMGLDSMPENNMDESLFFRSKSLNSLHFFPDFTSKSAAFHRRSATVNSSSSFSFKIEEENKENRGGVKQSVKKKQGKREKVSEVSFRSKSLNSLHFFPDFNSKKASQSSTFHRRSATMNSSSGFSFKIEEENVGSSKSQSEENRGGVKKKQGRREKVSEVSLKGYERSKSKEKKKKYEEGFASSTARKGKKNNGGLIRDGKCAVLIQKQGRLGGGLRVNDVGLNASTKKRVHHNHNHDINDVDHEVLSDSLSRSPVLSDALSRSPVSVLDHHLLHLHLDYSPSKALFSTEDERRTTTNGRNKPTPKTKPKIHKETPQRNITLEAPHEKDCDDEVSSRIQRPKFDNNHKLKVDDQEAEVEEYFVGLLGQVCRLAEEEVKDPNWVAKSQGFRVHFVEELSLDFGGQILDLLLDQLLDELVHL